MADRYSEADEPELIRDPEQRAVTEAENAVRQFDAAQVELKKWLNNPSRRLRLSDILALHRVLMTRLSEYAGAFRPAKVKIKGSRHTPPASSEVPALMEQMCDYISENWHSKTALHLAAYALWRINWIHPFSDGNGRTARVVSNLILCARSGHELPGDLTIPEQISRDKSPYYKALEAADKSFSSGVLDVSILEQLLSTYLANQLLSFYNKAAGEISDLGEEAKIELEYIMNIVKQEQMEIRSAELVGKKKKSNAWFAWAESNQGLIALIGLIFAVIVALFGWAFIR